MTTLFFSLRNFAKITRLNMQILEGIALLVLHTHLLTYACTKNLVITSSYKRSSLKKLFLLFITKYSEIEYTVRTIP